jgi:hypothetical protein
MGVRHESGADSPTSQLSARLLCLNSCYGRMVIVDGNFAFYDYVASAKRIDDILNQPSGKFEEADSLPVVTG